MALKVTESVEYNVTTDGMQLSAVHDSYPRAANELRLHNAESSPARKGSNAQELNSTKPDSTRYPRGWRLALIMVSLCLGTLLVAIDNTIIGVAVPRISTVFDSLDDVGWYGSAYLLTVTALQPTFGNMYKYFDIKITYMASVLVFEGEQKIWA